MNNRARDAKRNIGVALVYQFVVLICGLIVPRILLNAFGSEVYGATTSIIQFLSFVSLLEGGIGGVARAALYKPLADNNIKIMSAVVSETKRFFRIIAYVFVVYVVVIATSYKSISNFQALDWISTFILVIVLSFGIFIQYFFGVSYSILLQAAQKTYVTYSLSIITTIVNMFLVIILIRSGYNIIIVKLGSSCIFALKPIWMWLYVREKYELILIKDKNDKRLTQKWTGLGQHIAYFLYTNTDVAVLTILTNLKTVAVYSVHYMIIYHVQNIASSFSTGMEALFGDMIAKGEQGKLQNTFGYYDTLISVVTIILYSVMAVLIVPFIRLYTAGINDVDYYRPTFAFILLLASALYCLRIPYHSMTIAAGHFKQTRMAAYGEAVLNISLSIILVLKFNMVGVAIGTVVATTFRFLYYGIYLSNYILERDIMLFVKRIVVNSIEFALIYFIGLYINELIGISSYTTWLISGVATGIVAILVVMTFTLIFYRQDIKPVISRIARRK